MLWNKNNFSGSSSGYGSHPAAGTGAGGGSPSATLAPHSKPPGPSHLGPQPSPALTPGSNSHHSRSVSPIIQRNFLLIKFLISKETSFYLECPTEY